MMVGGWSVWCLTMLDGKLLKQVYELKYLYYMLDKMEMDGAM